MKYQPNGLALDPPTSVIAIDFETKGGGGFGKLERVYGFSWSTAGDSGWIDLDWIPGNKPPVELQRVLSQGLTPVFHNAAFDVTVARDMGINIPYYHDTMVMGYCVNPNINPIVRRGKKASKYSLWAWGIRLGSEKIEPPGKWEDWVNSPTFRDELSPYAIQDARLTWKLYAFLYKFLSKDTLACEHYQTIERPYIDIIIEMNCAGMLIDKVALSKLEQYCTKVSEEALAECRKIIPLAPSGTLRLWRSRKPDKESVDPVAGKFQYCGEGKVKEGRVVHRYREWVQFTATDAQVRWALVYLYDWQPHTFTEKSELPKVSGDILSELEYPLARALCTYNEVTTLIQMSKGLGKALSSDSRVRCSWNQVVTKTGRLSSSEPNLQNIPTRSNLGSEFRKIIVSPPGQKLVGIDLSQIEYRVMAALQWAYYQDTYGNVPKDVNVMVDSFINQYNATTPEERKQWDIHTTMATLWNVERSQGKNVSFARMYSASDKKLASMCKCSLDQAKRLHEQADAMNPSFNEFKDSVTGGFTEHGGVGHTLFGRRLIYVDMGLNPAIKGKQTLRSGEEVKPNDVKWRYARAVRQCFNAYIQGTAADVLKLLTLRIIQFVRQIGAILIASVHDELLIYCPEEKAVKLQEYLNSVFRDTDLLPGGVPVEGAAVIGKSWYEVKG